jgi:hypothetical protein
MEDFAMVNASPKWEKAPLIEPSSLGYIHIGAAVSPPSRPGPVFRLGGEKKALLRTLKERATALEARPDVERVTVFRATAFMPGGEYIKEHPEKPPANFDVVVLVETRSPDDVAVVQDSDEYKALMGELEPVSKRLHIIRARNLKRIGDVDKTRQGTFVFNHLIGDNPDVLLEHWEWLGGWYLVETGLDNSTLFTPIEGQQSDYVAINNARWEISLPHLILKQLPKRSFWNYVTKNLDAHNIGAWPVFYKLA